MTPSARVAQQTWFWCDGDFTEVLQWLTVLGCTVRQLGSEGWAIDGLSGLTVGLNRHAPDPRGVAVCLALAVLGPGWLDVLPDLLTRVEQEWRVRQALQWPGALPTTDPTTQGVPP